jgi:hypothetical protein
MSSDGTVHLDEAGQPCAHHGPARLDRLLRLAFVGTRTPGFNHDFATRLQTLLLTVDALSIVATRRGDDELRGMAAEVSASAQQFNDLLAGNRALVPAAPRTCESLRDIVRQAIERSNIVLLCELPDVDLAVTAPAVIHALVLAFAVAAAVRPGRGAEVAATCHRLERHLELELEVVTPPPDHAPESLAVAAEMLSRDGGDLRCGEGCLRVRLPLW